MFVVVPFPCDCPRGAKEVPGEQSCPSRWHQYPDKMYIKKCISYTVSLGKSFGSKGKQLYKRRASETQSSVEFSLNNGVLLYKEFSNSTLKSIKLNKHKSCSSWILNTHHHRTIGVSWRWSEHIDRNVELLHYYYGHLYSKKTKLCKRWLCIVVTRMFKFNIKASCSSWILNRPTTNWDQFHKEF